MDWRRNESSFRSLEYDGVATRDWKHCNLLGKGKWKNIDCGAFLFQSFWSSHFGFGMRNATENELFCNYRINWKTGNPPNSNIYNERIQFTSSYLCYLLNIILSLNKIQDLIYRTRQGFKINSIAEAFN